MVPEDFLKGGMISILLDEVEGRLGIHLPFVWFGGGKSFSCGISKRFGGVGFHFPPVWDGGGGSQSSVDGALSH